MSPSPTHPRARTIPSTPRRTGGLLRRRLALHLAGAVSLAAVATLVPGAAEAAPWPGHPDRTIVRHVVRPGETPTGLAVRYHAWTDELLRLNGLGSKGAIYRGQVIRIPVVLSAVRRAHGQAPPQLARPKKPTTHPRKDRHRRHRPHAKPLLVHRVTPPRGWLHADLTRDQVRHLVSRMARRYDVPRPLALAIAWQESGWQQRQVSSAGALGVMQVMPGTGRWMRWYAGRPLRLRDIHDNILAGVLALRILRAWTRWDTNAIAAYYQGLGAVRKHGYFRDTKTYVRSVRAHQRSLIRTGNPV